MLFNREKRIKYLGFDDRWFMLIGILVLSLIIDYLFNNSFVQYTFGVALINWGITLGFTIINWSISRSFMVFLRGKYPLFKDNLKRISIILLAMIGIVVLVDRIGDITLAYIFEDSYHAIDRTKILTVVFVVSITVIAIYEAIYLYVGLGKSIRQEEQAKQVIVEAKLDALRNQARPHFLFNSLNTLRDIIDQEDKQAANQFVDKLADVYRFILESGNANLISLRQELEFAKAYVYIQSERFGENLQIQWDILEISKDLLVVPMSLQLLLENAIKHNVISKANPLMIKVSGGKEKLSVSNEIREKSTKLPSTKLGLKNIVNRYRLISEKIPMVRVENTEFVVILPLLKQANSYANIDY